MTALIFPSGRPEARPAWRSPRRLAALFDSTPAAESGVRADHAQVGGRGGPHDRRGVRAARLNHLLCLRRPWPAGLPHLRERQGIADSAQQRPEKHLNRFGHVRRIRFRIETAPAEKCPPLHCATGIGHEGGRQRERKFVRYGCAAMPERALQACGQGRALSGLRRTRVMPGFRDTAESRVPRDRRVHDGAVPRSFAATGGETPGGPRLRRRCRSSCET